MLLALVSSPRSYLANDNDCLHAQGYNLGLDNPADEPRAARIALGNAASWKVAGISGATDSAKRCSTTLALPTSGLSPSWQPASQCHSNERQPLATQLVRNMSISPCEDSERPTR